MLEFLMTNSWIIFLIAAWTIPWKGVALWMAAQRRQKIWFIVILILNTLAILEIIYIFFFSKEKELSNNEGVDKIIRRV